MKVKHLRHRCMYPSCNYTNSRKKLFKFPLDEDELEIWLERIPFVDFSDFDVKHAFICIDHFEESAITVSKKLKKGAIPTIFENPKIPDPKNSCRFCLFIFGPGQKKIQISELIRERYYAITSQKLAISEAYADTICSGCASRLRKSYFYKYLLINNQEFLFNTFNESGKVKKEDSWSCDDLLLQEPALKLEDNEVFIPEHHEEEDSLDNIMEMDPTFQDDAVFDDFEDDLKKETPVSEREEYEKPERNVEKRPEREKNIKLEKSVREEAQNKEILIKQEVNISENPPEKKRKRVSYPNKYKNRTNTSGLYECDYCGKIFKKKHTISNHVLVHKRKYKCKRPGCKDLVFQTRKQIHAHMKRVHYLQRGFFCHLCGMEFHSDKRNLDAHIRSKHTKERPFRCDFPECPKKFYTKDTLQGHKNQVHTMPPVQCKICGKVCKNKDTLRCHMRYHSGKTYDCDFEGCGKQFVTSNVLKLHKKIHMGLKDFPCKYDGCLHSYHTHPGLKKHIWSVHMGVRIPCEVPGCTSRLTSKEVYRSHFIANHKNLAPDYINAVLARIRKMKLPEPQYTPVNK